MMYTENSRHGSYHHAALPPPRSNKKLFYSCVRLLLSHFIAAVAAFQMGLLCQTCMLCDNANMSRVKLLHNYFRHSLGRGRDTNSLLGERRHSRFDINVSLHDSISLSRALPSTMHHVLAGISSLDRLQFNLELDLGAPQFISVHDDTATTTKNNRVLLLHRNPASILENPKRRPPFYMFGFANATLPCKIIHSVVVKPNKNEGDDGKSQQQPQTCTAVIGTKASTSLDVLKYARQGIWPLTRVGRYHQSDGKDWTYLTQPPQQEPHLHVAFKELSTYLAHMDEVLVELQLIAEQVATAKPLLHHYQQQPLDDKSGDMSTDWMAWLLMNKDNRNNNMSMQQQHLLYDQTKNATDGTIIVMVSNQGHADMLLNFCCAARRVGMPLNKILLFATDKATQQLAQNLGLTVFYHPALFANIPQLASSTFGSDQYAKIMLSKLMSVHLVSELGYNFLFQDVDIVVKRGNNYLEWFVNKSNELKSDYDIMFQYDFSPRLEYAPWIANSGCYFVRNSPKTRHFFSSLVTLGMDLVLQAKSHQATMNLLLDRFASRYGLRIYTLKQEHELLPIGWHFLRSTEYMKQMIHNTSDSVQPLSFHYNWNSNKKIKLEFLEQMGDWHVQDKCQEYSFLASEYKKLVKERKQQLTTSNDVPSFFMMDPHPLLSTCCQAEPQVKCHYIDAPSLKPCPPDVTTKFSKNRPSFW